MREGCLFCSENRAVLHPPCWLQLHSTGSHPVKILSLLFLWQRVATGAAAERWGHWAQWSAQGLEPLWDVSFLPPQAQGWGTGRHIPSVSHHLVAPPGSAVYEKLMSTPDLGTRAFNSRTGFLQSRHGQMTIFLSNQPELWYTSCQLCAFMPDWCQLGDDRQFLTRHKVQVVQRNDTWSTKKLAGTVLTNWCILNNLRGQNEFLLGLHFVPLGLW